MNRLLATEIGRRALLGRATRGTLSLGALTLLTGCDISDADAVQRALDLVSRWNDRVQAALFGRDVLARTYPDSAAKMANIRFNAIYGPDAAPKIDPAAFRLTLAGAISDKRPWTLDRLYALPQESQVTRHVCVEGWSYIGKWTGTPLRVFLERIGADTTAKYVGFECADGYYEGIDMPSALHPQTMMAFKVVDQILPARFGYPFKIRMPTKLGFKNPKYVTTLFVTNQRPAGFWDDRGYNWFSGS